MNENPANTTTPADELKKKAELKKAGVETELEKLQTSIATLRAFVSKWYEILAPFDYSASAYHHPTISFYSFGEANKDSKAIARSLGNDGWKREKNPHTCGAINWVKEIDGVKLTIHEAEKVDMKLIQEVKL